MREKCRRCHNHKARGTFQNAFEHRLGIGNRAADNLQHLGSGRLPLQGLFGFVEQTRVLDRDYRLCREVLQQLDLLLREWPHLLAVNGNDAEHNVVPDKGRLQRRSRATEIDECPPLRVSSSVWLLCGKVDVLNGRPFALPETIWRGERPWHHSRAAQIVCIVLRNTTQRGGNVTVTFEDPQPTECCLA